MSSVTITVGPKKDPTVFLLTEEHERSAASGSPVLVAASGEAFGPYDCPFETGGGLTARAIASYALEDHPEDADVAALVGRFLAVSMPPSFPARCARVWSGFDPRR